MVICRQWVEYQKSDFLFEWTEMCITVEQWSKRASWSWISDFHDGETCGAMDNEASDLVTMEFEVKNEETALPYTKRSLVGG